MGENLGESQLFFRENTVSSFSAAVQEGATFIELDVQVTSPFCSSPLLIIWTILLYAEQFSMSLLTLVKY